MPLPNKGGKIISQAAKPFRHGGERRDAAGVGGREMKDERAGGREPSVDERYTQWKTLVPVLYDWLANHNLVWPSLSCRLVNCPTYFLRYVFFYLLCCFISVFCFVVSHCCLPFGVVAAHSRDQKLPFGHLSKEMSQE